MKKQENKDTKIVELAKQLAPIIIPKVTLKQLNYIARAFCDKAGTREHKEILNTFWFFKLSQVAEMLDRHKTTIYSRIKSRLPYMNNKEHYIERGSRKYFFYNLKEEENDDT